MARIEFTAKLVGLGPKKAWTFLTFPRAASAKLGSRGRVPIAGTINGFGFRSSAFPTGDGTHQISVNKAMQAGARAEAGDRVRLRIEVDAKPRTVRVPTDMKRAITAVKTAEENFGRLSWSHRKEYVQWITEAKRSETRQRRIREAVERLSRRRGHWE